MLKKLLPTPTRFKDLNQELNIRYIDLIVIEKFKNIITQKYCEKRANEYLVKLEIFSLLTDTKINHISILNNDYSLFFSNFAFFLEENGFSVFERDLTLTRKITYFLIDELNKDLKIPIKLDINLILSIENINKKHLKYLLGWAYSHKNLKSNSYLNLYQYAELFGLEEANKIEKIIQSVQNFRTETVIFNIFIKYLVDNQKSIFKHLDKELLHDFMKLFFNQIVEKNKCLSSAKRVWNIFIRTLKEYFNLDKKLKLSLTRKHKNPNEMNLKNINGNLVKNKLITHIPLEITDDKALYLIKNKIKQDLNLIREWAILNLTEFDDNNKSSKFITKKELYSIFVLLVLEQPSITESFLTTLKNQNSYIKIDNKLFLVGYKARKGNSVAEQKIALSDFSVEIINKYLDWISNFKKDNDSFFIYKGKSDIVYYSLTKDSLYNDTVRGSFKKFLQGKDIPLEYINDLGNNAYLSKIRASSAIQIYFETENTTKMAQALGHTSYNPRLLSHYLPQSILDFYQQRWIRIFQKGLICESLKNNSLLFKASNFETMEQLDEFLKNHMLKNLPDNLSTIKPINIQNETNFDNIYVSINQENLTALFSLRKAVEEAKNKDNVCEKAYFWFHFSEQIEKEILNKREYNEFKALLSISKEQAISDKFNQVIYE
jgi:hypothetical protein